jgi:hypothetical protein
MSPSRRVDAAVKHPSRAARAGAALVALVVGHALLLTAGATAAPAVPSASGPSVSAAQTAPPEVKFYIVPPPVDGRVEFLFEIAEKTLRNGNRFPEIVRLNKGRLQPDGGRLEDPNVIRPGWILQLPQDASGPTVQVGRLPEVRSPGSGDAGGGVLGPPAEPGNASSSNAAGGGVLLVGGAIVALLLAGAGIVLALVRRRKARRARRRAARAPQQPTQPKRAEERRQRPGIQQRGRPLG